MTPFLNSINKKSSEQLLKPSEVKGKIYSSYGHTGESNWILPLGFEPTSNIQEADLVLFGGGKDVDPSFYNEAVGIHTDKPNERDKQEKIDFLTVQQLRKEGKKIKTIGICRGGQLICALSGGKLIQHVTNHCSSHKMSTYDKKLLHINSIHHQMMLPYNLDRKDYRILGWSQKFLSSNYLNGQNRPIWLPNSFKELEIVYFTKTDALAIQFHPEMMFYNRTGNVETLDWLSDLFNKFYTFDHEKKDRNSWLERG